MAKIFDIEIKNRQKNDIYDDIQRRIEQELGEKMFITTLNPEIALLAKDDHEYRKVLQGTYSIVDGIGLKIVLMMKYLENFTRITGADLCEYILISAYKKKRKVLIVMRREGFSSKGDVHDYLKRRFNNNHFKILYEDELLQKEGGKELVGDENFNVLIVSLGAPKQEMLIKDLMESLPTVKVAMGVGGTFDYWTNKKRRAPKFFRIIGLEWLWRLFLQPNRIRRIANAVILFPLFSLIEKNEQS